MIQAAKKGHGSTHRALARCDECGREEVVPAAVYRENSKRPAEPNRKQVVTKLEAQGWAMAGKRLRCPNCEAKRRALAAAKRKEEDNVVAMTKTPARSGTAGEALCESHSGNFSGGTQGWEKSSLAGSASAGDSCEGDGAPRRPDRVTRRRILDELEGCYDDAAGRYAGDNTDQKVGKRLGVPWAWVAEIRADFFGDANSNEQAEQIARRLAEAEKALTAREEEALALAASCEAERKRVAELKAEIERLGA
ncbi:hypothetical protein C2I36_08005 [Rhodobacteraceae bacterium WD3A24]|nr:hypothetical protein C2I36_08005 [Rhodobacteraceae bacterium WD3A24]